MARKRLTKAIEELVNAIDGNPLAEARTLKNPVMAILPLAQALEDGSAISEAESNNAILKQENQKLSLELQELKTELKALREEQRKRDEKDRDLPDDLFKILKTLPSRSEGWTDVAQLRGDLEVVEAMKIEMGDLDVYLSKLGELTYATNTCNAAGVPMWQQTINGSKYVMAKRLAGEEEERKAYKHHDLPQLQHEILLIILRWPNEMGPYESQIANAIKKSLEKTKFELRILRKAGMATDGDEPQATYGFGQEWWLLEKAHEYFDERGLL